MFKVHFFNSIWSDCIILEKDNHYALIDTASSFYYEALKKYIDSLGIKEFDFLLLTHFHSDHYGNILNLLNDYKIKDFYFREYTNHEAHGSDGEDATNEYNRIENEKSLKIKNESINKTNLIILDEKIKSIDFNGQILEVLASELGVKHAFENPDSPFYQVRRCSDNYNSVSVFFEHNNHSVYLAGDITDYADQFEELNKISSKCLKQMYEKYNIDHIELYKAAHHGGSGNNPRDLLELISANYVVITNTDRWLDGWSTVPNIKAVNPSSQIYRTDYNIHVFDLSEEQLELTRIPSVSEFILQGKN